MPRVDGVALGAVAAGALFMYAGVKGYSIPATLQAVVQGRSPAGQAQATPIGGAAGPAGNSDAGIITNGAPGGGTDAANRALGKLMAGGYGWATGINWQALDHGWGDLESSWSNDVWNGGVHGGPYQPGVAYGIPQARGHGPGGAPYPAGNAGNPPGAGGNSSAVSQIAWGLKYIRDTYGSPSQVPGWLGGPYSGY